MSCRTPVVELPLLPNVALQTVNDSGPGQGVHSVNGDAYANQGATADCGVRLQ
jgi:hypothetical protein